MTSPFCGPCPENTECAEVTNDECVALESLYVRMLDKDPCVEAELAECSSSAVDRTPKPLDKATACRETPVSLLKRFDELMMAVLESRAAVPSDPAHDKAAVPHPVLFSRCRASGPGTINASLYGLDVERAVLGPPVERDELLEAANALMKAEAACKHGGAVRAAEIAALAQHEPKHAEDAARIGAKAYTTPPTSDKPGGSTAETPIEVVGYVGCTKPPPVIAEDECPKK